MALILLALGVSGLAPLAVVNSRQTRKLRERVPANALQYLTPSTEAWAAKLGQPALVSSTPPEPLAAATTLVDDQGSSFALDLSSAWLPLGLSDAYDGGYRRSVAGGSGAAATWTFFALEPRRYEVWITYPASTALASNAPCVVYDDATAVGSVAIDQRIAPTDATYEGLPWKNLGQFTLASGTLRVTLIDAGDGPVAADAVRIREVTNLVEILAVDSLPEQQEITVQVQVTSP